jgi:hypothetical protein
MTKPAYPGFYYDFKIVRKNYERIYFEITRVGSYFQTYHIPMIFGRPWAPVFELPVSPDETWFLG